MLPGANGGPDIPLELALGKFVKLSLRTRDEGLARVRNASIRAQLEKIYDGLRKGPRDLSHRECTALSGEVYKLFMDGFSENPGSADAWAAWKGFNRAVIEGRIATAPPIKVGEPPDNHVQAALEVFGAELTEGIDRLPGETYTSLEGRFGLLATWVLSKHGIAVSSTSRLALLAAVSAAAQDAGRQLKRQALGDYRPDPMAGRFPRFVQTVTPSSVTLAELFSRWAAERQPSGSTMTTWKGVCGSLARHLGREDTATITAEDIIVWKDRLVKSGLSPKTINDTYLTGIRTIFSWGVANKLVRQNVAAHIKVLARLRAGSGMLPYNDDEVTRLLRLSSREEAPSLRWLPWLAAATGARIGELAQLWADAIVEIDGVYAIELRPAPDGGTFKNEGSERTVPLHSALIEAGFLDFVLSKRGGPLFYARSFGRVGGRHASKGVTNRIAYWIRSQGFSDRRKAPNHALRHWWKTTAARLDVSEDLADLIQGHAPKRTASIYRHFDIEAQRRAIERVLSSVIAQS